MKKPFKTKKQLGVNNVYGKYENLTVIQYEEARNNRIQGGYKYLIRGESVIGYTAFRTDKGFHDWLERANLTLQLTEENYSEELGLGMVKVYKAMGTIEEFLFWKLEEIPKNAIVFKSLSNGSLVDCYYVHTENGSQIFRPNPNAKEVYHPLPTHLHIAYQRVNG